MHETHAGIVRRIYEVQPYPPVRSRLSHRSHLPALRWLQIIDRKAPLIPNRILVAGCGTGFEVFTLARAFPEAEIIGIDFSARSMQLAKEQQSRLVSDGRVRFLRADLCDPRFAQRVHGEFELIVCHGVLSYIPEPERALRNLAQCLRGDGRLYLGVNGPLHFSATVRPVLAHFGYDLSRVPTDRRFRRMLQLWETISERAGSRVPRLPAWYLQGDLFCPVILNFSLGRWQELARKTGLFLVASFGVVGHLRRSFPDDQWRRFFPASRQDLCELTEIMSPASFHRLLFAREKPPAPPWQSYDLLKSWQVLETGLYRFSLPKAPVPGGCPRKIRLCSPAFDARFEWRMPAWVMELLRPRGESTSLERIVGGWPGRMPRQELAHQLFLLWHLGILNLLEPQAASAFAPSQTRSLGRNPKRAEPRGVNRSSHCK